MIITTNILMLPIVILIWAIDSYLLLLLIRQLGAMNQRICNYPLYDSIVQITDPFITVFHQWVSTLRDNHVPQPLAWLMIIVAIMMLRSGLIALL